MLQGNVTTLTASAAVGIPKLSIVGNGAAHMYQRQRALQGGLKPKSSAWYQVLTGRHRQCQQHARAYKCNSWDK